MKLSVLSLAFFTLVAANVAAADDIAKQCVDLFKGSLTRLNVTSMVNIAIETIAKDSCSGSSFNLDAGFDSKTQTLIDGVPGASSILGSLGISSTKKLCEAYKSGKFTLTTDDRYMSEPVVAAMEQANKCMELSVNKNVIFTHSVLDPGKVSFGATFRTTERQLRFTVQTTGGFQCESAKPGTSRMEKAGEAETIRRADFSVSCSRKATADGGNLDFKDGVISINFGEIIYTVRVPADSVYGATSRRAADTLIAAANSLIARGNEALVALHENYAKRTYTPQMFFFGEQDAAGIFGGGIPGTPRFPCEVWAKPQVLWEPDVASRLCAGGTIKNITQLYERGGNRCGYHYYNLVCERPQ
ncbi:hypothetical protein [Rhizobium leguminosarum]|uniref:hypothetical protein n=1 Tax=Rhizobium leguminosarum TaxID=384 RepID=UPI001030E8DF|nr:hypothetical protein [Rhizobium leguminosarum]NEI66533.1 hypothetical protein [Rhizobium leguminosarum]TBF89172.1 hypothetical protein ELG82_37135 [Rhizobium leguminosarum]